MREILFRGKKAYNDEWDYSEYPFGTIHCGAVVHDFIPETVGQYTGLTDKNGKKIFEGDIVNITYPETIVRNALVTYVGASFYGDNGNDLWVFDDYISFEVIGNIHDNPELFERRMIWTFTSKEIM